MRELGPDPPRMGLELRSSAIIVGAMKTEDLLRYEAEFDSVREALGGASLTVNLVSGVRAISSAPGNSGRAGLKVPRHVDIGSSRSHDLDRPAR